MLAGVSDQIEGAPWNAYMKLTQGHRTRWFAAAERDGATDFTAWATKRLDEAAEGGTGLAPGARDAELEAALERVRYAFRSKDDAAAVRSAVLLVGDIIAADPKLLAGFLRRPVDAGSPTPTRKPR